LHQTLQDKKSNLLGAVDVYSVGFDHQNSDDDAYVNSVEDAIKENSSWVWTLVATIQDVVLLEAMIAHATQRTSHRISAALKFANTLRLADLSFVGRAPKQLPTHCSNLLIGSVLDLAPGHWQILILVEKVDTSFVRERCSVRTRSSLGARSANFDAGDRRNLALRTCPALSRRG
jgi:hypothetical protein